MWCRSVSEEVGLAQWSVLLLMWVVVTRSWLGLVLIVLLLMAGELRLLLWIGRSLSGLLSDDHLLELLNLLLLSGDRLLMILCVGGIAIGGGGDDARKDGANAADHGRFGLCRCHGTSGINVSLEACSAERVVDIQGMRAVGAHAFCGVDQGVSPGVVQAR